MALNLFKKKTSNIHHPCIWMQAGVVYRKFCQRDYDCVWCNFDRSLKRIADENRRLRRQGVTVDRRRGRIVCWKDRMIELPPPMRPCIHHMRGRIEFKSCTHEYRCSSCDFDQFFMDHFSVYTVARPVDVLNIKGFKIPQGYYLHSGHAWVKIEEKTQVRIGIDDFALRLMGPFDRIDTPLIGKTVEQGRTDIRLTRGTHFAGLLSPVTGVVTAVNQKLRDRGGSAGHEPYTAGWIATIHAKNLRNDLKNLMILDETENYMDREVRRLQQFIEEATIPPAADGGYFADDIYGKIPELGWEKLSGLFLRSCPPGSH